MPHPSQPKAAPPQSGGNGKHTITDEELTILARASNLPLKQDYYDGIRSNLQLLRHYSELVETMELPDPSLPAYEYTP